MSEQFLFTTAKTINQDTLSWTNHSSTPTSNLNISSTSLTDSINETYVTVIEENDTAYLSVLETTNETTTLDDLHNLTLDNSKGTLEENLEINTENVENIQTNDSGENQVVVFTVEGSDDLFGVQLVQDDEGKIQKYQFQFRTTEEGTLEAIPDTIQLLPDEDENVEQQIVLQSEEIVESQNDDFDQYQIQYGEENQENAQQEENSQETTTHFDIIEQNNHYEEEQENFNEIEERDFEDIQEYGNNEQVDGREANQESKTTFKIFVKRESNTEEGYEDEIDQENTENSMDIKPAILELRTNAYLTCSNIKQEEARETLLPSFQQEETVEVPSIGNEEILAQDESTLLDLDQDNDEKCVHFESNIIPNTCNIMDIQHLETETEQNDFSEDDSGSDSQPEVSRFKRLFIEDRFADENRIESLQQDTILQVNEEGNEQESDNETYEITHGTHVTAEGELIENASTYHDLSQAISASVAFQQQQLSSQYSENILKPATVASIDKGPIKCQKKQLLYYLLPHPEKENLNTIPVNNCVNIYNNCIKTNPRSVLKPQTLELKVVANPNSTSTQDQDTLRQLERMEKRFSRSKEAVQARIFNNFINKTTIPHAPVRQKRLPRKQEIKPVDTRKEEEIIVQEVMVSSSGFVESIEERLKAKDKLEVVSYIELVDSDDENVKTSKPKKKMSKNCKEGIIEIISSDDEELQKNEPLKRGRGRPKKKSDIATSTSLKRDRVVESKGATNHDESSPSKKSRTESSENDSDDGVRKEICSKILHAEAHPDNCGTRASIFEYKHKCVTCEATFKNALMLSRHMCLGKTKTLSCEICKLKFKNLSEFNIHSRTHRNEKKEERSQGTSEIKKYNCDKCQMSFKNVILLRRHVCLEKRYKCMVCNSIFKDHATFKMHRRKHLKENLVKETVEEEKQITPRKMSPAKTRESSGNLKVSTKPLPAVNVMKKFSCSSCGLKFASRLLLDLHTRRNCVKIPQKSTPVNRGRNSLPIFTTTVTTPLNLTAPCPDCAAQFRTITLMLQHRIKVHNYSPPDKEAIMKPKKDVCRYKEHGGVPANPRLNKAFQALKEKLLTAQRTDDALEVVHETESL